MTRFINEKFIIRGNKFWISSIGALIVMYAH